MAKLFTIVNRTSRTLKGVWDGRHYDLEPGKHSFPELQALKFKEQNPRMGTEDPSTLQCDYLIGIEELNDDCSPIEQTDEIERWRTAAQRKGMKNQPVGVVKSGLYASERHSALPLDSTFVKP
jgi:hypothetical protein